MGPKLVSIDNHAAEGYWRIFDTQSSDAAMMALDGAQTGGAAVDGINCHPMASLAHSSNSCTQLVSYGEEIIATFAPQQES